MNSNILNGSDIVVGGSIIIPIDMRTDDTTISITIKGIYIKKPMIKAALSSLKINAGTNVVNGISSTSS